MEFMTGVKKTDLLELPELQDKSLVGQTVKETDFCSASTKKAKRDLI